MPITKTAIVTGGGTGIGRACAELLSQTHRVISCGLDHDNDFPQNLEFRHLDVTDAILKPCNTSCATSQNARRLSIARA